MSEAMTKKPNSYMKMVHLLIGIVAAVAITNIPGPAGITRLGMALIGTFLVANYWFIAVDMITGGLAAMVLFVMLSGTAPTGGITSVLGSTTVW